MFFCGTALVIFPLKFVGCQILLSRLCWPYKMCWKPFQLFLVSERICACCYFFLVCLSEFAGELSSVLVICIFKEFAIFLGFHCFKLIMMTLCYLFHVGAVSSDVTAFTPSYITSLFLSLFHSLPLFFNQYCKGFINWIILFEVFTFGFADSLYCMFALFSSFLFFILFYFYFLFDVNTIFLKRIFR